MAEIVSISEYRERSALRVGYRSWRRFFKEEFPAQTRLCDLSPAVLGRLAEPGKSSDLLFYSLIIGFLGFSANERFETLGKRMQMHVVDVHLFLSDQVRFEMMWRMGWLARFGAEQHTLFELVRQFDRFRKRCQENPPLLASSHPRFNEYEDLIDQDKQVFIRRMFQDALDAFRRGHPAL
ncbi:MAG: hypothetical protein C4519_20595 [Desulfobacteraceae bacterium]|nr:MAG: hypothetical protein C4519_20595 [Desulfobacteraceae bacterium]